MAGSPFPRKLRTGLLVGVVVGLLAAVAVRYRPVQDPEQPVAAGVLGWFERLELAFFDLMSRQYARGVPASPEIAFVRMDEESLVRSRETLGPWPWPRAALGQVIEELRLLGARLVVLDERLAEPSTVPDDDRKLVELVGRSPAVVFGFGFSDLAAESAPKPGRWALLASSHPDRAAALAAAAPMLASGAAPYLVPSADRMELWLGGHRDKASALAEAEKLKLGTAKAPTPVRELTAAEALHRVTGELVFAERNAVSAQAAGAGLRATFRSLRAPLPALVASPAVFGAAELVADSDGVVRSVRQLVKYEGRYFPSLALAARLALDGQREVTLGGGLLTAGEQSVPVDRNAVSLLRFFGRPDGGERLSEPYPSVPVLAVLKSAARRAAGRSIDAELAEKLAHRVVFVSREAPELGPQIRTPVGPASSALVWAAALEGLTRGGGLVRASTERDSATALAMALLGAALAALLTRTARPRRSASFQAVATLLVAGGFATFVNQSWRDGLWVGAVIPLLAYLVAISTTTALCMADEGRLAQVIREALGRATPPTLVEALLRSPQHFSLEGERRAMSAWYLDIQGFGELSQGMAPRALVKMMNEYLTVVAERVGGARGQVDKFVGDAVLAYWGAPLPNHRHAFDACRCALEVRTVLARKRPGWKQRYGVELRAQAGLATGDLVVGDVGARGECARLNYTVLGEAVSLARQLERANRLLGTEILISEPTFEVVRDAMETREVDLLRVPGRPRPMRVFELLALKGDLPRDKRSLVAEFEKALIAYRRRDFAGAIALLEPLVRDHPDDRPSRVYLERCRSYVSTPPADEWDGVFDRAA